MNLVFTTYVETEKKIIDIFYFHFFNILFHAMMALQGLTFHNLDSFIVEMLETKKGYNSRTLTNYNMSPK